MIPVYLRLTNFMSHVNSEIKFDELDPVTLIVGIINENGKKSNGAGKSAFFDGITWSLFEKSRANDSSSTGIDDVVRGGADKCEVEFQFLLGKDLYRIIRSRDRKKRKSDLLFQVKSGSKWNSVAADSKRETNSNVIQTIGIDYDVFVNSVLLKQHEAAAFADMTSGERKEVVTKVLQLSHYEEYVVQAKKHLDELNEKSLEYDTFIQSHNTAEQEKVLAEQEIKTIKEKIEIYQKRIESLINILEKLRNEQGEEGRKLQSVKDLFTQRDQVKQRIQKTTNDIRDMMESIKKSQVTIAKLKDSIMQKQERIMQIKKDRGDASILKREVQEWSDKIASINERKTNALVQVETLTRQVKDLYNEVDKVKNLNEGLCATCYQPITANCKQTTIEVLSTKIHILEKNLEKNKEKLSEAKVAQVDAEKHAAEVQVKRDAFNSLQQEGRMLLEVVQIEKDNFETHSRLLEDNQSLKKSSTEALNSAQEELAKYIEKIDAIGQISEGRFRTVTQEIKEKNLDFESLQVGVGELQRKVGGLEERIYHQQQVIKKIEYIKEQRSTLDRERRIEKELIGAFGKTGIQALILENSAIEIEKIANNLLSKLTNGNVNIKIQTQKLNQDGTMKEVFDIIITDEYHASPFNMYSGGEKFRIAFVVRMALSILLSRRSGVKVGAIFYDEAFQDLDEDGIDRMIEIFKLLSDDFRYQMVITHTSQLKDHFKDVLIVNKSSEGSFVTKKYR